jgi:phosphatidylinositol glycan class B
VEAVNTARRYPADRWALAGILVLSLAIRLWVVATHTYLAHPDETFQYLEPAHLLAFGSGIVAWEYIDGIRSWLLPGAIAGIMRAVSLFDPGRPDYIPVLRLLCVGASLSVPYAGYRIADRLGGVGAGLVAGLLCALSPQAIYFAPVIMTEPLVTDLALLAVAIGGNARGRLRPLLVTGVLFGLASALRYQLAPVFAAAALWQFRREPRACLAVAGAGIAVVLLALGVLDTATWGLAFQSVWLNFLRNGPQGVSQAMGTETWAYYLLYFVSCWGATTPFVLICLALGARRAPALALLAVGTVGLHMLVPHKELRFILLATASIPILIGIGLHDGVMRLPRRWSGLWVRIGLALTLALAIGWGTETRATPLDAWRRDRSAFQAMAVARTVPDVCGLAIRSVGVYLTGGYSYWHRNVPIYFDTWEPSQILPGSDFKLRLDNVIAGRSVPQYATEEFPGHPEKFNAMIGVPGDILPGFTVRSCFGSGAIGDYTICVFTRPGDCS